MSAKDIGESEFRNEWRAILRSVVTCSDEQTRQDKAVEIAERAIEIEVKEAVRAAMSQLQTTKGGK